MKTTAKIIVILIVFIGTVIFMLMDKDDNVTFMTTYGFDDDETGMSVLSVEDGYLILGTSRASPTATYDIYLVKTDKEGDVIFENKYGGAKNDRGHSIIATDDGCYMILGRTDSKGEGKYDFYLMKLDSDFKTVWDKTYGGPERERAKALIKTRDGGYAIFGSSDAGCGNHCMTLIKVDENGEKLWEKTYGKDYYIWNSTATQTPDGSYLLLGRTDSIGAGDHDFYLVKTDENGERLWGKVYGGEGDENPNSVKVADDGGYMLFGWSQSFGTKESDMYLVKVDENGEKLWEKTYGNSLYERGYSMDKTSDGGYILLGNIREPFESSIISKIEKGNRKDVAYDQNLYLIKIDKDGNEQWSNTYGGDDHERAAYVIQTRDGGYALVGSTRSYGMGGLDVLFVKTDKNGQVSLW